MRTSSFLEQRARTNLMLALGILLSLVNLAGATVYYVDVNSAGPTPPYTNWATAATTIQAVVDAASPGDEIVVTNGVYVVGGHEFNGSNRVAVTTPVTIRSANGPQFTIINGAGTSRTGIAVGVRWEKTG